MLQQDLEFSQSTEGLSIFFTWNASASVFKIIGSYGFVRVAYGSLVFVGDYDSIDFFRAHQGFVFALLGIMGLKGLQSCCLLTNDLYFTLNYLHKGLILFVMTGTYIFCFASDLPITCTSRGLFLMAQP